MRPFETLPDAEALIEAVAEWWRQRPGAIAAALVGSYARGDPRPESDVDFVLLCQDPHALLTDTSWTRQFGEPVIVSNETWGDVTSLRVRYPECEWNSAWPPRLGRPISPTPA